MKPKRPKSKSMSSEIRLLLLKNSLKKKFCSITISNKKSNGSTGQPRSRKKKGKNGKPKNLSVRNSSKDKKKKALKRRKETQSKLIKPQKAMRLNKKSRRERNSTKIKKKSITAHS